MGVDGPLQLADLHVLAASDSGLARTETFHILPGEPTRSARDKEKIFDATFQVVYSHAEREGRQGISDNMPMEPGIFLYESPKT